MKKYSHKDKKPASHSLSRDWSPCEICKKSLHLLKNYWWICNVFLQTSSPHRNTFPQWPAELWPPGCRLPFVILFPKRRTHKEWWVVFVYLSGWVYSPFSIIVTLHVRLFSLLWGMSPLIKSISSVAIALLLLDREHTTFLSSPCRFLFWGGMHLS